MLHRYTTLDINIDSDLSTRFHVQQTVSRCFTALRQLRSIRRPAPTAVFRVSGWCNGSQRAPVYCNNVLGSATCQRDSFTFSRRTAKCCSTARLHDSTPRCHRWRAYQPPLAANSWENKPHFPNCSYSKRALLSVVALGSCHGCTQSTEHHAGFLQPPSSSVLPSYCSRQTIFPVSGAN